MNRIQKILYRLTIAVIVTLALVQLGIWWGRMKERERWQPVQAELLRERKEILDYIEMLEKDKHQKGIIRVWTECKEV